MNNDDNSTPFDLSKTRKYDKKTDKDKLSKNFYKDAKIYLEVAMHCFSFNLNWMPAVLCNISFSCELFLKAILYGFGIDFKNTHGLKNLFEKLPENKQSFIKKSFIKKNILMKNTEEEFMRCLAEQNEAFTQYRYMCEAKSIVGNPKFLFAFADILKDVYESLVKENLNNELL